MSLSSRRAWIEIAGAIEGVLSSQKSLSSRRAWIEINDYNPNHVSKNVALLAESVDWNLLQSHNQQAKDKSLSSRRAWIEMILTTRICIAFLRSLSSRRAWIEITNNNILIHFCNQSLSSRRAWIEIPVALSYLALILNVALLAESVDWNLYSTNTASELSPVALLAESVDWNLLQSNM